MSCSRTQHGGGRFRTPDLSLRSPTLYHWATALPRNFDFGYVSNNIIKLSKITWFWRFKWTFYEVKAIYTTAKRSKCMDWLVWGRAFHSTNIWPCHSNGQLQYWSKSTVYTYTKWLNLTNLFDLTQLVTEPTTITQTSATLIVLALYIGKKNINFLTFSRNLIRYLTESLASCDVFAYIVFINIL